MKPFLSRRVEAVNTVAVQQNLNLFGFGGENSTVSLDLHGQRSRSSSLP